jgi:hypothetical protein
MKKFRMFLTIFFLLTSLIIILLIALYDNTIFFRMVNLIKDNIWPAGFAMLIFLVLLSAGVVSNLARSGGSLISNGYFQLAMLELFLFSGGLAYYRYYSEQPGQIVLRLQPETSKEFINIGVKYQSSGVTSLDTVTAPGALNNRLAGKYRFETVDQDIVYFQADVVLEPAAIETLVIPIALHIKTLVVQTEPTGANIWINGIQASQTPDSFKILSGDTVSLDLKMPGYQTYTDTIHLNENMDLGVVPLRKLFTLWVSCRYPDIEYRIYDTANKVVLAANNSRKIQLVRGKYRLSFEIGEGQYKTKTFSLDYNYTVNVP